VVRPPDFNSNLLALNTYKERTDLKLETVKALVGSIVHRPLIILGVSVTITDT
jgi:hypothetical protein